MNHRRHTLSTEQPSLRSLADASWHGNGQSRKSARVAFSRAAFLNRAVLFVASVIAIATSSLRAACLPQDAPTAGRPADTVAVAVASTSSTSQSVFLVKGECTAEGLDAILREALLRCYVRTQGRPFVAALPVATAADADAHAPDGGTDALDTNRVDTVEALDAQINAAFLAVPNLREDRAVQLVLGPWVIRPKQPTPNKWWETQVEYTAEEISEATERMRVESSQGASQDEDDSASSSKNLRGLLRSDAKVLALMGKLHAESIAGLVGCVAIAIPESTAPTSSSSQTAPQATQQVGPQAAITSRPLGHPFVPYLGFTPALELIVWIQSLDAMQCALRAEGVDRQKDADSIVADIRAVLLALEAYSLCQLLDERVPRSAPSGASLCASPSWPNDAWELIAAVEKGRKKADRVRAELLRIAAAVAAQLRLPPEVLARLEERLETVADKLPFNVAWNQRIADEIRGRLIYVMAASGSAESKHWDRDRAGDRDVAPDIGGNLVDRMQAPDDIVGGRMAANRATWDVYGYLWSGKDALLPSEQAQLELQRSVVLSQLNTVAAEFGTPRAVVELLTNDLARNLTDQWRPWMHFPVSNEALTEHLLPEVTESMRFALDDLPGSAFSVSDSWRQMNWWGIADCAFAMYATDGRTRHRNQPFPYCRPYFINGVGLMSTR
jgi:hypothetical protein